MKTSLRGIAEIASHEGKRASLERRLAQKIDKRGPDECWPWTAKARHKFGYGVINAGRGNLFTVPRVVWTLANGPIPHGKHILHSCDNPLCCNPAHLRIGTHADNMRDAKNRGRLKGRTGAKDHRLHARKLNADAARFVRMAPYSSTELSSLLGVSMQTIASIKSGRTWADA